MTAVFSALVLATGFLVFCSFTAERLSTLPPTGLDVGRSVPWLPLLLYRHDTTRPQYADMVTASAVSESPVNHTVFVFLGLTYFT